MHKNDGLLRAKILRRSLLVFLAVTVCLGSFSACAVASDWTMFRSNLGHTGTTTEAVGPPFTQIWNYTTGAQVLSSLAVSGGVVFVGSLDDRVYAFAGTVLVSPTSPAVGGEVLSVDKSQVSAPYFVAILIAAAAIGLTVTYKRRIR